MLVVRTPAEVDGQLGALRAAPGIQAPCVDAIAAFLLPAALPDRDQVAVGCQSQGDPLLAAAAVIVQAQLAALVGVGARAQGIGGQRQHRREQGKGKQSAAAGKEQRHGNLRGAA